MFQECVNCGLSMVEMTFKEWLEEIDEDDSVTYEQCVGGFKETMTSTVRELLQNIKTCLPGFLRHCYVKRTQSEAFKKAVKEIVTDEIVLQVS
jgi:hypothetical protein